jgi:uncharacterized protein YkwD
MGMNRTIVIVIMQAVALICVSQAPPSNLSPEQQLFKLLNIARHHAGLEELQWDPKLAKSAQAHSEQMAQHSDLSHLFPGEPDLEQRVGSTGVRFDSVAENVAIADDPEAAHLALMNSPGHRANILSPKYNAVGLAVVRVKERIYITQDFAHVVPTYSQEQFRDEVVAAFNRARKTHRFAPIASQPDPWLDEQACAGRLEPQRVLHGIGGAVRSTIFTATQPAKLPPSMEKAAGDPTLQRMNIGVCFRPDDQNKFSRFWVVAAFYPSK